VKNLELKIGCLGDPDLLPAWVKAGAPAIAEYFNDASAGAIDLAIEVLNPKKPEKTSSTVDLHLALREIISGKQDAVGLLLCNRFDAQKGIFGIMFDTGFAIDNESLDPRITGMARQGCAVFMDAISEVRHDAEYIQQVLFTSVHELGHVFNLPHVDKPPNFMKSSSRNVAYGPSYFEFLESQKEWLAGGKMDKNVWPGGSDFGEAGLHHREDDPFKHAGSARFGLDLRVSLARQVFNYFDPIELDIELRLAPGIAGARSVPNTIDPGYDAFRLWIEEPDGSRRRYRSPRKYCWNGEEIEVTVDRPFLRDISIFAQASGYTFRRAGVHRLWAEFLLSNGERLVSPAVDFEIVSSERTSSKREKLFTARDSRVLLYHRALRRGVSTGKMLVDYADQVPADPAAAGILYSLGRAYLDQVQRLERAHDTKVAKNRLGTVRDQGKRHLERALTSKGISRRQRQIAETILG
jgi:hypothetical protein